VRFKGDVRVCDFLGSKKIIVKNCSIAMFMCFLNTHLFAMENEGGLRRRCVSRADSAMVIKKTHDILDKFNRVLYFPLESKKKKEYRQEVCVATIVGTILPDDYRVFAQKYPEKSKILHQSLLWEVARLPKEVQRYIVTLMMKADNVQNAYYEDATNVFLKTPFLYAMDRYVSLRELNQSLSPREFMKVCPYGIVEEREKWQEDMLPMIVSTAGGFVMGCIITPFWGGPAAILSALGSTIFFGSIGSELYEKMSILGNHQKLD